MVSIPIAVVDGVLPQVLTMGLPLLTVVALGVWYTRFTQRVPGTPTSAESSPHPADATPGPDTPQVLPTDPAL